MPAQILQFPRDRMVREPYLSKAATAAAVGYSPRWLELRMRDDGLPYHRAPNGAARFLLSEVEPFVEKWKARMRVAS